MGTKFANFGGQGGASNPYAPGGSPTFRGRPNNGSGVDDFMPDLSLDSIMSKTHKPKLFGFDRPFESLLEAFHNDLEKDAPAYLLDFDERRSLKKKKKIRNKEQHLKNLRCDEVSKETDKIKTKFKSVEEMLDNFRLNNDKDYSKLAQRMANFYRRKGVPPLLDDYLPTVEEYEDDGNPLNLTENILSEPFLGQDVSYRQEDGLDKYIEQMNSQYYPNMHSYFTGLMDYTLEDQRGTHSVSGDLFDTPSPITEESKNNNISLEKKLEKLKQNNTYIGRLDPDALNAIDWDKKIKGQWPERGLVNETPYEMDGFGGLKNDYIGGNNPYNSVSQFLK